MYHDIPSAVLSKGVTDLMAGLDDETIVLQESVLGTNAEKNTTITH